MKKHMLITTFLILAVICLKAQVEVVSTGTSTAYVVNIPGAFTLKNGIQVTFKSHINSTASATLNVSATGAISIRKNGDSTPLSAGDILANQVVTMAYDGTYWQMVTPTGTPATSPNYWTLNSTHIYNNNAGNIGIGTTNPTGNLHVYGSSPRLFIQDSQTTSAAYPSIELGNTNAGSFNSQASISIPGSGDDLQIAANNAIRFNTSFTERMIISNSGNVGIRVNPTAVLHLNGSLRLDNLSGTAPAIGSVLTSIDAQGNAEWQPIPLASNVWNQTGNAGTVDGINFIGTTDNVPFTIRVNNVQAGKIDASLSNSFYGYWAGRDNNTGSSNAAIGANALVLNTAGIRNTALGTGALQSNTTGSDNIAIGAFADVKSSNLTNAIAIGANTIVARSNSMVLGKGVNVGVGMTSPSVLFHIQDSTASAGKILMQVEDNLGFPVLSVNNDRKVDVNAALKINDGTQGLGKILTSDAAGNASWKANQIAFFAGGGGSNDGSNLQSLSSGTAETLQFEVALSSFFYNQGNGYNPSTHRFKAPVSGVYQLEASVEFAGAPTGYFFIDMMHISGKGITSQEGFFNTITQNRCTRTLSATVHLNVGEEVWIQYLNTNGAASFYKSNSSFSGHLVYAD